VWPTADVAAQGAECRLVEDLSDQPEVLVHGEGFTIGNCDPCGFLATMLQSEEPEVGETCGVGARGVDPEDPTGFSGPGCQCRFGNVTLQHAGSVGGPIPTTPLRTARVRRSLRARIPAVAGLLLQLHDLVEIGFRQ
jgi:hypothetical protein